MLPGEARPDDVLAVGVTISPAVPTCRPTFCCPHETMGHTLLFVTSLLPGVAEEVVLRMPLHTWTKKKIKFVGTFQRYTCCASHMEGPMSSGIVADGVRSFAW